MPPMTTSLLTMLEDSLRFEYIDGNVTSLRKSHTTGMRNLPFAVCAAISGGTTRLFFEDTGDFTLSAGQAFVAPAGVRHSSTLNSPSNVSRWAHFRVTVFDTVDAFHLFSIPHTFRGKTAKAIGAICEELTALAHSSDAEWSEEWSLSRIAKRKALGFRLFAVIAEAGKPCADGEALLDSAQRLRPVMQRLHAEPEKPLSLADMAHLVHLSPSRFSALFRSRLGVSPGEYQRNIRMSAAKTALLDSEKPIARIAGDLGFEDPFQFSKSFKKSTGMNPRQYRTELRMGMWR
jgi:AraC-like DNA-binding protein